MALAARISLVAALLLLASVARAQPSVLIVLVEPGDSGLSPDDVRRAISKELNVTVANRPAAGARGTLVVRVEPAGDLAVSYRDASGRELSRVVDLPADPARRLDVIALLAGNLARDEASSLIDGLRPSPSGEQAESEVARQPPVAPGEPARAPAERVPRDPVRDQGAPADTEQPLGHAVANLSLFAPLALYPASHERRINLEIGLAYSRVGAIQGLGLNAVYHRVEQDVSGVVAAGIGTSVEQDTRGVLVSGIFNHGGGALSGVEATGVANVRARRAMGAQVSGVLNIAGGVSGLQGALVNVGGDLDGLQLGLVNVAGRVRGVQLGLVNVADDVDGLSFGLANVIRKGRTQVVLWSDTVTVANVGVKYVMGPVQSMVSAGADFFEDEVAPGIALGGHFEIGKLSVEPDVLYRYVFADLENVPNETQYHSIAYRLAVSWQLSELVGVFAGGGLEQQLPGDGGDYGLFPYGFTGLSFF